MPTAPPAGKSQAPQQSAADALAILQQQAEAGQFVHPSRISPLTEAADANTRSSARVLLARMVRVQADTAAADLLAQACCDVGFRAPNLLAEAMQYAANVGKWDNIYELNMRAAETFAAHGDFETALVALHTAAGCDIGHGSHQVNDPEQVARFIKIYECVATRAAQAMGIQPAQRGQRRSPSDEPLRMAHVTCQLVDAGHAPSRSLDSMLRHMDRDRFAPYLCISDSLAPFEAHSHRVVVSPPTDQRAPRRLADLRDNVGVTILQPSRRQSYLAAAKDLHEQFAAHQIDIAYFHGSLATPIEWLLGAWQVAPWQFDAGFGVPLHCPYMDYQHFEFEETREALAFWCRERNIPYGTKHSGVDATAIEEATPHARADLQIPEEHVILGSIGNHQSRRMSREFCQMIAKVLRARPHTTLIVVGQGDFGFQRRILGPDLCDTTDAPPRVRFVGNIPDPARYTKMFDIYVNSFPDGGGFVLGDAMAAAKPVVAIVCNNSTYARAGGTWLGEEHIVTPPTAEAYAERLIQLIDDPEERANFGTKLRARFECTWDARASVAEMCAHVHEQVMSKMP